MGCSMTLERYSVYAAADSGEWLYGPYYLHLSVRFLTKIRSI